MRTIKYRGILKWDGGWTYGSLVKEVCGDVWIFPEGDTYCNAGGDFYSESEPGIRMVNPETVGQFTGLHDRHGHEIYEGDIIRQDVCGDGSNGVVVYDEEHAMFALRYDDPHNPILYGLYDCQEKELEVVGNIHEREVRGEG